MEAEEPIQNPVQQEKPKNKKKKKMNLKLKINEESNHINALSGVGDEAKIIDSMSSSTYSQIHVSQEQIELQDQMDKFAPQVKGDTITLTKTFVEPKETYDSMSDVSMTSNSL